MSAEWIEEGIERWMAEALGPTVPQLPTFTLSAFRRAGDEKSICAIGNSTRSVTSSVWQSDLCLRVRCGTADCVHLARISAEEKRCGRGRRLDLTKSSLERVCYGGDCQLTNIGRQEKRCVESKLKAETELGRVQSKPAHSDRRSDYAIASRICGGTDQ